MGKQDPERRFPERLRADSLFQPFCFRAPVSGEIAAENTRAMTAKAVKGVLIECLCNMRLNPLNSYRPDNTITAEEPAQELFPS